jgi:hypothetical protein
VPDANIIYAPRADATPNTDLSALSAVYRFVLDCRARKEGPTPEASDAEKGSKHDSRLLKYTR